MADQVDELGQRTTLSFPLRGVDTEHPFDLQPPGTTPTALNVCAVDPTTDKARGGSRPGLTRFLPQLPTRGQIQHLQVIVDPQADALSADFGELPFGYLIQWEWIDDPSVGYGHLSGKFRNRGQVRKRGSGRDAGWNFTKTPTKIFWAPPADIEKGTPLSATQLNAIALEAPSGILSIPGTFEYQPPAGKILSKGKATLRVKFTPTDEDIYKGAVGQVQINVVDTAPKIPKQGTGTITGVANNIVSIGGNVVSAGDVVIGSNVSAAKDPGTSALPDDSVPPTIIVPADGIDAGNNTDLIGTLASVRFHYGSNKWYYYIPTA